MSTIAISNIDGIVSEVLDGPRAMYRVTCQHCSQVRVFYRLLGETKLQTYVRYAGYKFSHRKSHELPETDDFGTFPLF